MQRVVFPSHFCWRSCIFHYQPKRQRDRFDRRCWRFPCNLLLVHNHQCLKLVQKEQEKQERRSTRKWTYIVFAVLQMPEKHEEEEDEETNPEWQVLD